MKDYKSSHDWRENFRSIEIQSWIWIVFVSFSLTLISSVIFFPLYRLSLFFLTLEWRSQDGHSFLSQLSSVCPFIEGNGYYSCESELLKNERERERERKTKAGKDRHRHVVSLNVREDMNWVLLAKGHQCTKLDSVRKLWKLGRETDMMMMKREREREEGWHTVCCADQEHELKETRNWRENEGQRRGRRIWNVTSNRGSIIRGTKKMTLLSMYTFSSVVSSSSYFSSSLYLSSCSSNDLVLDHPLPFKPTTKT